MFQLKGNGSGSIKVQRVQLIPSQRRLPFPSKVGDATPTNRLKKEPRRFSARISANRVLARRDGRIPRKTTGISCKRRRSSNVLWRLPDSRCLWYGGRRACTLVRTTGGRVAVSCGSATRPKCGAREGANRPTASSESPHRNFLAEHAVDSRGARAHPTATGHEACATCGVVV